MGKRNELLELLEFQKKIGLEKMKKTRAEDFKKPEQYEKAWEYEVIRPLLSERFPSDIGETMDLINELKKVEANHKKEWIASLQNHHNKKYWSNYIQNKQAEITKDNIPRK